MLSLAMYRQEQGKRGAFAGVGRGAENPAVLLHDLVRHGQPQSGTRLLGGEERVEDAVAILAA